MLLWLGLTVWLNGERSKPVVPLAATALLAAAVFFLSHTMILGRGFTDTDLGMDFWWRIAWVPLPIAPFAWLLVVMRYAGLTPAQQAIYRRWQIGLGIGCALLIPIFMFANPFPSYASLVQARAVNTPLTAWIAGVPLMLWLYLPYAILCYLVPLVALLSPPVVRTPSSRARPWLAVVSFLLMSIGLVVIATLIWAAPHPEPLATIAGRQRVILFSADLAVVLLAALAVVLLVEPSSATRSAEPLPRRGFFRRWRRAVIIARVYHRSLLYRPVAPDLCLMCGARRRHVRASELWVFQPRRVLAALRPFASTTKTAAGRSRAARTSVDVRALAVTCSGQCAS
jgi:hypothetical protein